MNPVRSRDRGSYMSIMKNNNHYKSESVKNDSLTRSRSTSNGVKKTKPKIVVIGGGTGSFTILQGLKNYNCELSAIVAMSDDGGSTGRLRDELGVLPPGDVRQCLVALSESSVLMRHLFNYRFDEGGLKGHSFGNLFLSAMEKITGGFDRAVEEASDVLKIRGRVFPVTLEKVKLAAVLGNGEKIEGQSKITAANILKKGGIKKLYLKPRAHLNQDAKKAILTADLIVISPGDLYASLVPNFLVEGIDEAMKKSKAKKVCVVNLMNKDFHTAGFGVTDFVKTLEKYIGGRVFHYVIYNTGRPDPRLLYRYEREGEPVRIDKENFSGFKNTEFIGGALISKKVSEFSPSDKIKRSFIRHDSEKVAKLLIDLAG